MSEIGKLWQKVHDATSENQKWVESEKQGDISQKYLTLLNRLRDALRTASSALHEAALFVSEIEDAYEEREVDYRTVRDYPTSRMVNCNYCGQYHDMDEVCDESK